MGGVKSHSKKIIGKSSHDGPILVLIFWCSIPMYFVLPSGYYTLVVKGFAKLKMVKIRDNFGNGWGVQGSLEEKNWKIAPK